MIKAHRQVPFAGRTFPHRHFKNTGEHRGRAGTTARASRERPCTSDLVVGPRMSTGHTGLYFSDYFGVDPSILDEYGAFDISVVSDLPLFVDPFLLFNSEKPQYQALHESIITDLRFLKTRASVGLDPGLIKSWYCFKEVKQNTYWHHHPRPDVIDSHDIAVLPFGLTWKPGCAEYAAAWPGTADDYPCRRPSGSGRPAGLVMCSRAAGAARRTIAVIGIYPSELARPT